MPLRIEILEKSSGEWISLPTLHPGQAPGSMSHIRRGGLRDVYIFECLSDDLKSVIREAGAGIDLEFKGGRVVDAELGSTLIIKELRRGDEPYELEIRTDKSDGELRKVRFTHI